jgi:hypothetical protein
MAAQICPYLQPKEVEDGRRKKKEKSAEERDELSPQRREPQNCHQSHRSRATTEYPNRAQPSLPELISQPVKNPDPRSHAQAGIPKDQAAVLRLHREQPKSSPTQIYSASKPHRISNRHPHFSARAAPLKPCFKAFMKKELQENK